MNENSVSWKVCHSMLLRLLSKLSICLTFKLNATENYICDSYHTYSIKRKKDSYHTYKSTRTHLHTRKSKSLKVLKYLMSVLANNNIYMMSAEIKLIKFNLLLGDYLLFTLQQQLYGPKLWEWLKIETISIIYSKHWFLSMNFY